MAAVESAAIMSGVTPGADPIIVAFPVAIPSTKLGRLLSGRPAPMAAAETSTGSSVEALALNTATSTDAPAACPTARGRNELACSKTW